MKMPWGIFEGEEIEDLPTGYLSWLVRQCNDNVIFTFAYAERQWRNDFRDYYWESESWMLEKVDNYEKRT